mmetsp:Transcript_10808/g.23921  ORF Transcript_10808/g.23921 Transcript_10808/m.23921 type:complete len:298 (-) Transcript_10808:135-1028(-)|eukprot:CAMPEP_0172312158 /NCGR_PEP_ID=MMETSP1058-20130122/16822_1 /TAXON_ID=83371 /ORGANISM="Detonula confervacea, Strain CCMP 353" /LENGTH=297 /DNA_ID=CAMNT_0013025533 /DNA_START=131 /DNA_END=1027 /DNA_ORIENTATION=+
MNVVYLFSVLVSVLQVAEGFTSNNLMPRSTYQTSRRPQSKLAERLREDNELNSAYSDKSSLSKYNRRDAIGQACRAAAAVAASAVITHPTVSNADIEGVVALPRSTAPPEASSSKDEGKSVTVFKTKSGLQYIDIVEGTGRSPRYGNLVGISYKAYIKLPDVKGKSMKLDEFDSDRGYLVKHGNGRTIPGVDEALHTMKIGGKRRIVVPPKLGYVSSGLGPIPEGPYGRWKLNHLIDKMVELKGGNVIFDVTMNSIMEDEADQGYYDDQSLTPDEFNTLRINIETGQNAAKAAKAKT